MQDHKHNEHHRHSINEKHDKSHEHTHNHVMKDHSGHNKHTTHDHSQHIVDFKNRFWISLILTIPVVLLSEMIQHWFSFRLNIPYQRQVVAILSSIIYFYGGMPFLKGLALEIKSKTPGMMTLIATAITAAYLYSLATALFIPGMDFFWELATLIDVMLLGHYIEAKSIMGASKALDELAKLMPRKANLIVGEEIREVDIANLKKDDIALVKPGETIPADGIIIEGKAYINEALVTGESKPAEKKEGDEAVGGSINGEGSSLKITIVKTGEETFLSQVIKLVKEAQESKSKTQNLANKAAAFLFYIALGAGIITYISWEYFSESLTALERSVTVMVISCPHALGLAIPLVVAISTSMTANKGILIRQREAFETLKDITAIVFDKTGTLTHGEFGVTGVRSYGRKDIDELLSIAAAVEEHSEHIIAKAIVKKAKEKDLKLPEIKDFEASTAVGVKAIVGDKSIKIGGPKLLKEMKIEIPDIDSQGETIIYITINDVLEGSIALADKIKDEAFTAINSLKEMNIKVVMLTGDAKQVADKAARELNIDDYAAEVYPKDKTEKIKELKGLGYKVAMVGDGINDAPALATADVGIAIGAGTSVAIESGGIILVNSNPEDIVKAINFSKKTYSKMKQNLWWAAGYNIVALPLAAGVLAWAGIIIQPAIGAILMSVSTVIVALNSQTLRKEKL